VFFELASLFDPTADQFNFRLAQFLVAAGQCQASLGISQHFGTENSQARSRAATKTATQTSREITDVLTIIQQIRDATEQARSAAAYFVGSLSVVISLVLFSGLLPGDFLTDHDLAQVRAAETVPAEKAPAEVSFNGDIRPLLSDKCFLCHGPDKNNRKAELRLDSHLDEQNDRGDFLLVVPGNPQKSELYRRLTTSDIDQRMPPEDSDKKLSQ